MGAGPESSLRCFATYWLLPSRNEIHPKTTPRLNLFRPWNPPRTIPRSRRRQAAAGSRAAFFRSTGKIGLWPQTDTSGIIRAPITCSCWARPEWAPGRGRFRTPPRHVLPGPRSGANSRMKIFRLRGATRAILYCPSLSTTPFQAPQIATPLGNLSSCPARKY